MERTESEVARLANSVWGAKNDARLYDGWRTYGNAWAWEYLTRRIRSGADRVGDDRPELMK